MTDRINFDERVAIVTGAGNGLGKEYALELGRRGAKVVVNDLGGSGAGIGESSAPADQVAEQIRDEGGEAVANHNSVATREGGNAIVQSALDAFGRVDICINNAGFLRNARFEDITDAQLDAILDVHLKGAFYVSQPAYRAMRWNGYGRFLFTGSASAMFGHAWHANYAAAKAGLFGLSNVVAIEGSAYGITSNLLVPSALSRLAEESDDGFREIPAFAQSLDQTDWSISTDRLPPTFTVPLALYLVSEQCTHTHGVFSSNSGRYATVRTVVGDGWMSPMGPVPATVEDVAANFEQVCDMTYQHEPLNNYEEWAAVSEAAKRQGRI